jgi:hypothetical protein
VDVEVPLAPGERGTVLVELAGPVGLSGGGRGERVTGGSGRVVDRRPSVAVGYAGLTAWRGTSIDIGVAGEVTDEGAGGAVLRWGGRLPLVTALGVLVEEGPKGF